MNPLEERIEGEASRFVGDHEFPIEHEPFCSELLDVRDDFREVASEGLARFRLQLHASAIAENKAAKAIPFRLVLPFAARWDFIDGKRFHRRVGRMNRQ